MYSPIKRSSKTNPILATVDKLVDYSPSTQVIRLTKNDYKILFDSIPQHIKHNYVNSIPYKDREITFI